MGFLSFLMDTHCPVAWKLLCVHGQKLSNFNDGMVHLTRRLLGPHYMSFEKFLFAVESHDLSQADKSIIRMSSFPILQNFNF